MIPIRIHQACHCGPLLVAALALALPLPGNADDPAPPTVISTPRAPAPEPKPAGTVQFQAYRNFDGHGPGGGDPGHQPHPGPAGQGRDGTPMEIPLAVELATCPDGNTEVSAINAGGWRHESEGVCENSSAPQAGAVTLHQGKAAPASAPAEAAAPARPAETRAVPRCDPATWNCSSSPQ
ncbi:MAG: hypothetical protein KJ054_11270 [Gammaproteobacteria bacterium]|nr:hypothetical protein [Gammaproteobacteria bacterium]